MNKLFTCSQCGNECKQGDYHKCPQEFASPFDALEILGEQDNIYNGMTVTERHEQIQGGIPNVERHKNR